MRYTYDITISLNLGKLAPPVQDLCDSLNSNLANFGVSEKVVIRSDQTMVLEVSRQLTSEEESKITAMIESEHKGFDGKVTSFRRQSGNVQQSVS